MAKCAEMLQNEVEMDFVDINVGCPIDLVFKKVGHVIDFGGYYGSSLVTGHVPTHSFPEAIPDPNPTLTQNLDLTQGRVGT